MAILLDDLGQDLVMMARLVQSQLSSAVTAFFQRDVRLAGKVTEKDDQVDNLLGRIEDACFRRLAEGALDPGGVRLRQLRGAFRVALSLEKLGDYAVNVAEQAVHASRLPSRTVPFDLAGAARVVLAALDEVIESFTDADVEKAKHACRCELELDRRYREALAEAFRLLGEANADPAFVITNLFMLKFLERIGDSILNIGESTLFLLTGERLKLHQYLHLQEMVGALAAEPDAATLDLRQIWGGISGARLGRVAIGGSGPLIWKEGAERKIEEELREMDEWNRLVPGLVPDVKARYHRDGRESFLGQFLEGVLLRDVYLARPWEEKVKATRRLLETLREIWVATSVKESPPVDYVWQIRDRLSDLYAVHPRLARLRETQTRVFGIKHRSLRALLDVVERVEGSLAPPVAVRLHGDFNTTNVIYVAPRDRVHFIDVHRSRSGDYVQDIGVFLVSNLRSPIQDDGLAAHFERLNDMVVRFAAEFAALVGDDHFQTRLTLAQARSFITSARLITDFDFARGIFLKGVRLLEWVATAA
jgi:phosphate uptake regulator